LPGGDHVRLTCPPANALATRFDGDPAPVYGTAATEVDAAPLPAALVAVTVNA
jgi:hypothetical protein